MPAKKTVSREKIKEAALKIVKKRGMEGLNMRHLAKECKCSTQLFIEAAVFGTPFFACAVAHK